MRAYFIFFSLLFLSACGINQEEKLILGEWKVNSEESWNKKIKLLDKDSKTTYNNLQAYSKQKRLKNYQKSVENIGLHFMEDKTFSFMAEGNIINTGIWEIFVQNKTPYLVLEHRGKQQDVFEIEEINKEKLILKVDKSKHKIILKQ